jgi:hypothetical protein
MLTPRRTGSGEIRCSGVDGRARGRDDLGSALAQGGRLTNALAQEVQLLAAGHAVTHDLDLLDPGRVDLEGSLDTDATSQRAHGVARREIWQVGSDLIGNDLVENGHLVTSW